MEIPSVTTGFFFAVLLHTALCITRRWVGVLVAV